MISLYLSLIDLPENKSRFEELYYEHRSLLFNVAYGILKDEQRSEDAVNEAFLSLAKKFRAVRLDLINFHLKLPVFSET